MVKEIISISLSKQSIEKINQLRGLIPRSTFIEYILKKYLEEKNGN